MDSVGNAREAALDIFLSALKASRVELAMARRVHFRGDEMEIDRHLYHLDKYGRLMLIAIGKAADTMARAFLVQAANAARWEGVIAGLGDSPPSDRFRVYRGGHPSPNEASVAAAEDILRSLRSLSERDLVVFLVSGGGSAMVEQSLLPEVSLAAMVATHKALVESGAPIAAINAVRKHLSGIKGGRMAEAAAPAEQVTVFVSDVPADKLDALSSGPTMPDSTTVEDVYRIAEEYGLCARLPSIVAERLRMRSLVETPKPEAAIFQRSQWSVLLDSGSMEEAAAKRAGELGWKVEIDDSCDDWDVERAADYLVERVRRMRGEHEHVCLLSAGEVTVHVPAGTAGTGGRNQHFALLCAQQIAGESIVVLSGGSDGIDGNSDAAGALVDGTTRGRAEAAGLSVSKALAEFDSYSLLAQLDDTLITGATGNNLRDLRILLAP
jgi:hydroxypyruvate reductase